MPQKQIPTQKGSVREIRPILQTFTVESSSPNCKISLLCQFFFSMSFMTSLLDYN